MQNNGLKYRQYYSTLLWLSISAIAYYLVHLKFLALDFHTRDYAFYTEFIVKWSRPVSEQSYSINPGGYNFLGIVATDGCDGFYQWVHFEPVRFVQAYIYKVFHSLQAVFIFNSLLVCSPVLAITSWLSKTSAKGWEYFLWVLLLTAFPATLLVAGYDNRPSMFLGVGYFWLLYTLLATKKTWLQFLFFVLLFSIREESIVINGFVLVYLFFRNRKKEISIKWLLLFGITWLTYLIGMLIYFHYWNYVFFSDTAKKYSIISSIVLLVTILIASIFILVRKQYKTILFIPFLILGFQLFTMFQASIFPDRNFSILNDPRSYTLYLIFMAALLNRRLTGNTVSRIVFLLIPFLLVGGILIGRYSLINKVALWKDNSKSTELVFLYKNKLSAQTKVITDYSTHQAFVEHWNLICMDRLPCTIEKSSLRFYPENKILLHNILQEGSTMVISKDKAKEIQPLLSEWSLLSATSDKNEFVIFPLVTTKSWEYQP